MSASCTLTLIYESPETGLPHISVGSGSGGGGGGGGGGLTAPDVPLEPPLTDPEIAIEHRYVSSVTRDIDANWASAIGYFLEGDFHVVLGEGAHYQATQTRWETSDGRSSPPSEGGVPGIESITQWSPGHAAAQKYEPSDIDMAYMTDVPAGAPPIPTAPPGAESVFLYSGWFGSVTNHKEEVQVDVHLTRIGGEGPIEKDMLELDKEDGEVKSMSTAPLTDATYPLRVATPPADVHAEKPLLPIEIVIPDEPTPTGSYPLADNSDTWTDIADPAEGAPASSSSPSNGQPVVEGPVKVATELKIGKIEGTVGQDYNLATDQNNVPKAALPASGQLNISNDPDRFRIRIKGVGKVIGYPKLWIATEGAAISEHNDPEHQVLMKKLGGFDDSEYTTDWQLLVSDKIDDEYQAGGVPDEATDDPTHVAELGSNIVIKRIAIEYTGKNGAESTGPIEVNIKIPVKIKRTVKVKSAVMADVTYTKEAVRDQDIRVANERLAQCGIKLDLISNRDHVALPAAVSSTDQIDAGWKQAGGGLRINPKLTTLVDHVFGTPSSATDCVQITFCNSLKYPNGVIGGQDVSGLALFPHFANGGGANPAIPNYANNIFISTHNLRKTFTVAHEIVHLLTNAGHYGPGQNYGLNAPTYLVDHNLMRFGTSVYNTAITQTKRIYLGQEREMIESPNNPNKTGL